MLSPLDNFFHDLTFEFLYCLASNGVVYQSIYYPKLISNSWHKLQQYVCLKSKQRVLCMCLAYWLNFHSFSVFFSVGNSSLFFTLLTEERIFCIQFCLSTFHENSDDFPEQTFKINSRLVLPILTTILVYNVILSGNWFSSNFIFTNLEISPESKVVSENRQDFRSRRIRARGSSARGLQSGGGVPLCRVETPRSLEYGPCENLRQTGF